LKDAARLLAYLLGTVLLGALLAPPLFWFGHAHFSAFANVDFESFFHRALLIAAIALLWPLLHSLGIRNFRDLGLEPNQRRLRDVAAGLILAAVPLLCAGAIAVALRVYTLRHHVDLTRLLPVIGAAIAAPAIEEIFFRGLVLGVLLRTGRKYLSIFATSALFSIIHFLKAPEQTSPIVTWTSGLNSIAHAFGQFTEPMLVIAGFATLFVLGWILADARIETRSLWLPIGLHAGWILAAGVFNKLTRRQILALPWLGKNLLIGIVPLALGLFTWLLVRLWLRYDQRRKT
jgi:membrane protease YdiL (CAAX protease family)